MMLTKAEALSKVSGNEVKPDRLSTKHHGHYPAIADEMLKIYAAGEGQTRSELHHSIEELFYGEKSCPPKRIRAFCKLLDDASEYEEARGGEVAALRMRVFSLAATRHPLVRNATSILAHKEDIVKTEIASTIGRPWSEIEGELFSDVYELQRLKKFQGYDSANSLLARYNEAQIQAALYSAIEVRITARKDYRTIVMAAKRAMLMHDAERLSNGSFRFTFYGPVSPLRTTNRYGIYLARIIPSLLTCTDWDLVAPIKYFKYGRPPELRISSKDRYTSRVKAAPEFDSAVERTFAERWGSAPRDGWTLLRESEPRFARQKAFFPDFTFTNANGRRVLFEIVGHWTPEYLKSKIQTLNLFSDESIILAVHEGVEESFTGAKAIVAPFKKTITLESIKAALAHFD